MSSLILGGIVSESRSIGRKRKIVVDSLRAMDVCDMISFGLKEFGNSVCGRCCIITTYGNKQLDIVFLEEVKVEIFLKIFVCRLEPAHLKI